MGYFVYILKSEIKERYYIGQTNNIKNRIERHINGRSKYTKYGDRTEAVRRERYLKSPKGYSELLKIKEQFNITRNVAQPG